MSGDLIDARVVNRGLREIEERRGSQTPTGYVAPPPTADELAHMRAVNARIRADELRDGRP